MRFFLILFILLSIKTTHSLLGQESILTLSFQGNSPQENSIIDSLSYQKSFNDLNSLKKESSNITQKLIDKGYIDARLVALQKKGTSSYEGKIHIQHLYKWISIHIPNKKKLREFINQANLEIKEDSIKVETASAKALLEKLTSIAANNGNPFASFQLTDISKTITNTLTAQLLLTSKEKRTIDNIVIKGYEEFPKTFLNRYAGIKTKKSFNQEELLKQNTRINNLPFAKTTKEPEVLFRKDSTTVYFYLEQVISNRFDGFIGFTSDEATNNLRLNGYIDLQLTNNFNYGETFLLNYKSDGGDQSQLNATISLPYLFKSPIGAEAKLALFRKDSTFSITNQEIKAFYNISATTKTSIGYLATQSENLQDNLVTSPSTTVDYTANKLLITGEYNKTQDNYFFPTKTHLSINSGLGNRTTDQTQQQLSAELEASTIINLNKNNLIHIRSITKSLWSDNYLTNELYRFGGITSIRGFEENSIFANFLSHINTEYRYVLNQSLYVHSLIDLGYFENEINNQEQNLFSFGIGTGIRTKAGVLKIVIANGKNENQNFDFNNTKLHFQLAIRF